MTDQEKKSDMNDKTESDTGKSKVARKKSPVAAKAAKTTETDKPGKADTSSKSTVKHRRQRSKAGKSLAYEIFLFFAVIGVIAGAVYFVEQQLKAQAINTRYAMDELGSKLNSRVTELENTNSNLQQTIETLNESQKNLTESFSVLMKTRRHLRNDWLLAEAEYLLNLSNHRLLLARDTGGALAAMQTADQRLHEIADPAIIPLRKQLAVDINKLKSVVQPDISGISLALNALTEAVDQLVLIAPQSEEVVERDNEPAKGTQIDDWRELPMAVWSDIKKLVVIREHHGQVKPLLTPEQHFFLKQNLMLKLEQAQLALLDGNGEIYRQRLQTAAQWLVEYFKTDEPATQSMLEQINELQSKVIQPPLPDISNSYRVLKSYREQQVNTDSNINARINNSEAGS